MISIIVPVFNAEKSLRKCIESILSQKYKDFELLLINDGSTDSSGNICNEYVSHDSRIRVFHQTNQGVSAARNLGLDNFSGDFVTFCDSDDWVEDTWLSDYIENYRGEDILFQNAIWHKENEKDFNRNVIIESNIALKDKFLQLYCRNTLGYVWAALFKAVIIRKYNIRFNIDYIYREDMNFSLKYSQYVSSINIIQSRNYHYILPNTKKTYSLVSLNNMQTLIEETELICRIVDSSPQNIYKISNVTYASILMYLVELSNNKRKVEIKQCLQRIKNLKLSSKCLPLKYKILHYLIKLPNFIIIELLTIIKHIR